MVQASIRMLKPGWKPTFGLSGFRTQAVPNSYFSFIQPLTQFTIILNFDQQSFLNSKVFNSQAHLNCGQNKIAGDSIFWVYIKRVSLASPGTFSVWQEVYHLKSNGQCTYFKWHLLECTKLQCWLNNFKDQCIKTSVIRCGSTSNRFKQKNLCVTWCVLYLSLQLFAGPFSI